METVTIFHNPRCSKSRSSLAILNEQGLEPEIRLYLEDPPNQEELTSILAMLDISARDLLRKGESDYKALNLANPDVSETEIIKAIVSNINLLKDSTLLLGTGFNNRLRYLSRQLVIFHDTCKRVKICSGSGIKDVFYGFANI